MTNFSPAAYVEAAALAREVGKQMLARLEWVTLQPKVIVDVGCGTGDCAALLRERYPEAKVVAADLAYPMLQYAQQQEKQSYWVCAEASSLPLSDHSVDLLFANLMMPWCADLEKLLREWQRVLRPDGLLMFTSFGPDTLSAWRGSFANMTIPHFIDMHDMGDMLTRSRFADPVLDVDYFTLTYREVSHLFRELQASGMVCIPEDQHEALLKNIPASEDNRWSAKYEIIFGHAWGPLSTAEQGADEFGTVRIPLSHLRRRG